MLVDRDAAPVVANRHRRVGRQFKIDAAGVPGHRLVHGVVENFSHQMMQGALVHPADIHAGPAAHGFQPLQNLDILGGVAVFFAYGILKKVGHGHNIGIRSPSTQARAVSQDEIDYNIWYSDSHLNSRGSINGGP